jgi:hypothetical protein
VRVMRTARTLPSHRCTRIFRTRYTLIRDALHHATPCIGTASAKRATL